MTQFRQAFAFTTGIYPECVMVCCKEHFVLIRGDGTSEMIRYDEFEANKDQAASKGTDLLGSPKARN